MSNDDTSQTGERKQLKNAFYHKIKMQGFTNFLGRTTLGEVLKYRQVCVVQNRFEIFKLIWINTVGCSNEYKYIHTYIAYKHDPPHKAETNNKEDDEKEVEIPKP